VHLSLVRFPSLVNPLIDSCSLPHRSIELLQASRERIGAIWYSARYSGKRGRADFHHKSVHPFDVLEPPPPQSRWGRYTGMWYAHVRTSDRTTAGVPVSPFSHSPNRPKAWTGRPNPRPVPKIRGNTPLSLGGTDRSVPGNEQ
jgi:hypothetical protein